MQKSPKEKRIKNKLSQEEKQLAKDLKEQKKQEREKLKEVKKAEQLRQKNVKAILIENQRNLKPEENIKFLKVHIDNEIVNLNLGGNIITLLQQNDIQYTVQSQIKSHVITWSKKKIHKELNDFGEFIEKIEYKDETELLYVIDWKKTINLINDDELLSHLETIRTAYIEKKITLVICGLKKYFEFWKKNNDSKGKGNKLTELERMYKESPLVTKDQLEFALCDLQLLGKHNCR